MDFYQKKKTKSAVFWPLFPEAVDSSAHIFEITTLKHNDASRLSVNKENVMAQ